MVKGRRKPGSRLSHQLDLADTPRLVEEGLERAAKAQDDEYPLSGDRLWKIAGSRGV
jgi:hypothetical protein